MTLVSELEPGHKCAVVKAEKSQGPMCENLRTMQNDREPRVLRRVDNPQVKQPLPLRVGEEQTQQFECHQAGPKDSPQPSCPTRRLQSQIFCSSIPAPTSCTVHQKQAGHVLSLLAGPEYFGQFKASDPKSPRTRHEASGRKRGRVI